MTCHESIIRIGNAIRYLDNIEYPAESYEEESHEEESYEEESNDCISIFGPCFGESEPATYYKLREYVPSFGPYDGIPVLAHLPRRFLWNSHDFIIQSTCQGASPILDMEMFLSLASNYYLAGEHIILDLARFLDTHFYDWKHHCCTCPDYRCVCGMVRYTLEAGCILYDVAERIAKYHEECREDPAGFKWLSNNATQLLSDYSYYLKMNIFECLPHVQPYIDMSYDYYCDLVVCGDIGIVASRSLEWPQNSMFLHQAILQGIVLGFDPYENSEFDHCVHKMHAKHIPQGDNLSTFLKQFTREEARNMLIGDDMRAKYLLEYTGIGVGCIGDYKWILENICNCPDADRYHYFHLHGGEKCIDRETFAAVKRMIRTKTI
jgi:hypothetical protein